MPDTHLNRLNLCEDSFKRAPMTPTTVVVTEVWGMSQLKERVMPLVDQMQLSVTSVGLRDEGIAVTFKDRQTASLFRLFYDGETCVGEYD